MLFVGVMTGTSVDGLDLALLNPNKDLRPIAAQTTPIPAALRQRLIALATPGADEITRMGEAHVQLGELIAVAVLSFLRQHGIEPNDIRAIGSHGQTIRHHPNTEHPFSIQIGDGNVIAERSGIDVIADFRGRDLAGGGQGAPLVPIYHQEVFGGERVKRAVINIGGIANVSILSPTAAPPRGFDTGPGNALLDVWIRRCRSQSFDADGAWARGGRINGAFLESLLQDPFYRMSPPKSTGKEQFNLLYVERHRQHFSSVKDVDVQTTLVELTALTIITAVEQFAPECEEIVVCGGGRRNGYLMSRISALSLSRHVAGSEALGVDGDAIEAAAFAYLAWRFVHRLPGNVPTVTGASRPLVLGCLYPAK